jgi:chromosome segregation ATPase
MAPPLVESRAATATEGTDMAEEDEGLRQRLTRQGEEAVGKLAQDLLENPLFANTLARAFEAREKAMQAQTVAMGALNLPSAADIERLTRRLRSVSQRLEGIEDGVERLDERLASATAASDTAERLRRVEEQLQTLTTEVQALGKRLPDESEPVSREQERLEVANGS